MASVGYVAVNAALLAKMKIRSLGKGSVEGLFRGSSSGALPELFGSQGRPCVLRPDERIDERGNEEADYVSIAPSSCPVGAELSAVPYVDQHFGQKEAVHTVLFGFQCRGRNT